MPLNKKTISVAVSCLLLSGYAHAQVQTLKDITQTAVLTNPEVLAKWHNYLSASAGKDAATGAFLPNLNFIADVGRDNRDNRLGKTELNRNSTKLSLNQMLYDGFFTSSQVKQLDHVRKARLYELHDVSENIALETVRAYADVIRFRKLVSLSEDNYVRHRAVFEQIEAKAKAGIGRRVDLEQIAGRLALAEANLVTETSNLHDVSARFQRLVGTAPAKNLDVLPALQSGTPSDIVRALNVAFENHPALLASIENISTVNEAVSSRRSTLQPRLDFRASAERGNNIDYVSGRTNNNSAAVVLSWNLFNGGTDKAKIQEAADQLNLARDMRDKTCRDIRQTVAIAYNDTRKLTDQLTYLDQHQLSIEKARDAYRQQFDIGQRSLLDLLDTENELFQAKRTFSNAEVDLFVAYARTHAGMGQLNKILGLSTKDDTQVRTLSRADTADFVSENCPSEAPTLYVIDKAALNRRATEAVNQNNPLNPAPSTDKAPNPAPTPNNIAANTTQRDIKTPANAGLTDERRASSRSHLILALGQWRDAWLNMNTESYFSFYSAKYTSRESWKSARKARLLGAQKISLELSDIKLEIQDNTHATTSFDQAYQSPSYQDVLHKTLYWEEIKGKWQIVNEVVSGDHAKQW